MNCILKIKHCKDHKKLDNDRREKWEHILTESNFFLTYVFLQIRKPLQTTQRPKRTHQT